MKKILIIGAGPAGLGCAQELIKNNTNYKIDIIEKEKKIGGLSKTNEFNGYYFDIGPHRFFSKIKEVNELWEKTLKKNFLTKKRLSRIYFNKKFYHYPISFYNTIHNFGLINSIRFFLSYLFGLLKPYKKEETFEQYISNKFGKSIYAFFFKDYTEKIWGISCSELDAKWASQRIKGLDFLSIVYDVFRVNKKIKKSLIKSFKYPKYGSGMMYEYMKKNIEKRANVSFFLDSKITNLRYHNEKWISRIKINNKLKILKYDYIISSIPLTTLVNIIENNVPKKIKYYSSKLSFRNLIEVCMVYDEPTQLKDTWIYLHDKNIKASRLEIINNWSKDMLKNKSHTSLSCEYFCSEKDDLWSFSDKKLTDLSKKELISMKIVSENAKLIQSNIVRVKNAYPVYDKVYTKHMSKIEKYLKTLPNFQLIGRGGMFKYNNMDHSIFTGILAARNILFKQKKYDLWKINQDDEYLEEYN